MTVYMLIWHSRAKFTVLASRNDELAVHSCPFNCLQSQVAKLANALLYCLSLLRNNKCRRIFKGLLQVKVV